MPNANADNSYTAFEVEQLFDRIAPIYDQLNDRLSFGLHRIWKRMAVKWTGVRPGDAAIDICCGSGDLALLLAKTVGSTGYVVGVDFSARQLAIARQRSRKLFAPPPLEWVEADALDLPCGDRAFDGATLGYGLRNVADIPRCLRELHRVLKPGAKAAILDFNRPDWLGLERFQQGYLDFVVVPAAERLGVKEDYAYIAPSLERFPVAQKRIQLARDAGFDCALHYPLAGGLMGVLLVER